MTNGHNTATRTAGGERQKIQPASPPRTNPFIPPQPFGDRTGTLGSMNGEGLKWEAVQQTCTHTHPWHGCYGQEGHVRLPSSVNDHKAARSKLAGRSNDEASTRWAHIPNDLTNALRRCGPTMRADCVQLCGGGRCSPGCYPLGNRWLPLTGRLGIGTRQVVTP